VNTKANSLIGNGRTTFEETILRVIDPWTDHRSEFMAKQFSQIALESRTELKFLSNLENKKNRKKKIETS
jgi:hypothetical protein